ncbi:MAG TPA: hypothetical protein VKJ01_25685 [Candidatus Solibacter sp.]|nr:hypothetical protein [Candidatus Solibacter sp.]
MFGIADAWLLQPLHFSDPGRLAIGLKAESQHPTEPNLFLGFRDWEAWAGGNRSFANLAAVFWRSFEAADPSEPGVFGMLATANLFDTLGVAPARDAPFALPISMAHRWR